LPAGFRLCEWLLSGHRGFSGLAPDARQDRWMPRARPTSTFLRDLEAAVTAELRAEMQERLGVALRVGVLRSLSYTHGEIRRKLSITAIEHKRSEALLRRAALRMPGGGPTAPAAEKQAPTPH
jgi:hypothetical protein